MPFRDYELYWEFVIFPEVFKNDISIEKIIPSGVTKNRTGSPH